MDPTTEQPEGWYTDPYGRHEARWLSDGEPTKLVRDGETESYDEPPEEDPTVVPLPIEEPVVTDGGVDLLRVGSDADLPNMGELKKKMTDAALEGAAHPVIDLP